MIKDQDEILDCVSCKTIMEEEEDEIIFNSTTQINVNLIMKQKFKLIIDYESLLI